MRKKIKGLKYRAIDMHERSAAVSCLLSPSAPAAQEQLPAPQQAAIPWATAACLRPNHHPAHLPRSPGSPSLSLSLSLSLSTDIQGKGTEVWGTSLPACLFWQ
ncbi:hypothetical protein XENTR_v10002753 [Xenopus tropicalis]|nr:hypothetical protein XENTR_v10002753 [Xenopus tropicalis]